MKSASRLHLALFVIAFISGYAYIATIAFKPYEFSYLLKATPVLLLALIAFLKMAKTDSNALSKQFLF